MTDASTNLLRDLIWPIFILTLIWLVYLWGGIALIKRVLTALTAKLERATEIIIGPISITVPEAISEAAKFGQSAALTAEKRSGVAIEQRPPQEIVSALEARQWGAIGDYPNLMHVASIITPRTVPNSGRYSVRVWLEFDHYGFPASDVEQVIYRIHDSFRPNIIATRAQENDFELWLSVFGEFTVIAVVVRKSGEKIWLTRYLDLPGRPSD